MKMVKVLFDVGSAKNVFVLCGRKLEKQRKWGMQTCVGVGKHASLESVELIQKVVGRHLQHCVDEEV